jgi:hypothetical protein
MRAYKAGQIPHSETQDMYIFRVKEKRRKTTFYCEKWEVGDLNYTILDCQIQTPYGLVINMS